MAEKEPTVSHADLDAALEDSAATKVAAEPEPKPEPELKSGVEPDPAEPEPEPEPEPEKEPEPEPEPEPAEPEDHKERSKMGRRMSMLEDNIDTLVTKIDQLITVRAEPEDPDDDEPVFMTKKQLREFVRTQAKDEVIQTKAEDQATQKKYEDAYISHVRKIGADLSPKQLEAVFKEMYDRHNEVFHKIPEADADINFHRAVVSLADKAKPAPKVIPLKKDDPEKLGGPADTAVTKKTVVAPKLDEHALAFAKHHKLTDEQVAEALAGETPLSLRGKIGS